MELENRMMGNITTTGTAYELCPIFYSNGELLTLFMKAGLIC